MHFRFSSAKWNAATRCSARPFTTKTGARVHFFCLNSPRNKGWYQARVHPFSSGNGKGDAFPRSWKVRTRRWPLATRPHFPCKFPHKMALLTCPSAFRLRRLAQNGCRSIRLALGIFPEKSTQNGSGEMSMCILTAQVRTKRWPQPGCLGCFL